MPKRINFGFFLISFFLQGFRRAGTVRNTWH